MPKMVNTVLNFKRAGRVRMSLIVLVLALFGLMLVGWVVTKWRSASRSQDRLELMATVRPDDEFWLTYEGKRHLLPRDQGVDLLRAMATAHPREVEVGFFNRGRHPPSTPPMKAKLVWCKDGGKRSEHQGNVLWIHSRNQSVNYEDEVYIVPAEGREILDRLFPLIEEKIK